MDWINSLTGKAAQASSNSTSQENAYVIMHRLPSVQCSRQHCTPAVPMHPPQHHWCGRMTWQIMQRDMPVPAMLHPHRTAGCGGNTPTVAGIHQQYHQHTKSGATVTDLAWRICAHGMELNGGWPGGTHVDMGLLTRWAAHLGNSPSSASQCVLSG